MTLFAAFAVGSALGWVVFRLVDRSDYAFDQREFSDAVSRRLWGRDSLGSDDETPPPGQLQLPPPRKSRAAVKLRESVRSSARAAAWRESRDPNAASDLVEGIEASAETKPEQTKAVLRSKVQDRPAKGDTPRQSSTPPRTSPRRGPTTEDEKDEGDPWPSSIETWPVRRTAWPAAKGPPQLPPADRSSNSPVITPSPNHADLWPSPPAEEPSLPAREPTSSAEKSTTPRVEKKPKRLFARDGNRPAADPDMEAAVTMLSDADQVEGRPPGLPEAPRDPDNLKLIKGIGPSFEKRLNAMGIYHFSQIAAWSPTERDWISQELGSTARLERDDWIGQAAELAAPGTAP